METSFSPRQFAAALLATAVIFGGLGFSFGRLRPSEVPAPAAETGESLDLRQNLLLDSANIVDVSDQAPGNSVLLKRITLEKSSWVAIHEDRGGKPGNILGAILLPRGLSENVSVDLLRPTVEGVYYAMLHTADDNREFDYANDMPLENQGAPVMRRFVVGGAAAE